MIPSISMIPSRCARLRECASCIHDRHRRITKAFDVFRQGSPLSSTVDGMRAPTMGFGVFTALSGCVRIDFDMEKRQETFQEPRSFFLPFQGT